MVEPAALPALVGQQRMRLSGSGSWNNLQEMAAAVEDQDKKRRFQLYSVVLEAKDYTEPLAAGAKFDKTEYYAHPERYRCTFGEKVRAIPPTRVFV